MLYHYTMTPTACRIIAAGVLRANPQTLYADAFGRVVNRVTPSIVWLTENPLGEGTTLAKAHADGYRGKMVGDVARILVDPPDAMTLPEYAESIGTTEVDWDWVLRTAEMLDIDPDVWRVLTRDIPTAEWHGVEVLSMIDANGTEWRALTEPFPRTDAGPN